MTFTTRGMLPVAALGLAVGIVSMPLAAARQDEAQIKKGQQVYTAQKCSLCHQIAGKGNKTGPLDGVGKKLTADEIREWILKPKEAAAKHKSTKKPVMQDKYSKLPAADIDALVAYMQSLK